MMPRVDGVGVLRFLEQQRPEAKPNVIVMTANLPGAHDTEDAKPVFKVLPKPFDLRQLVSNVHDCLNAA